MFAEQGQAASCSISGEFEVDGSLQLGQDVNLILVLRNLSAAIKSLTANVALWTIIYTGRTMHELLRDSLPVTLGPNEEKRFPFRIPYAEYKGHLTLDNMIQATALCHVEDGSCALVQRVVILESHPILLKVLGQAKVGEQVKVEVLFTNPLEEEVKDCVLRAEGSDLTADTVRIQLPPVKAKDRSRVHLDITPSRSGTKHLVVHFSCDKLGHVNAFEAINVDE
ncbi:Protein-glutamine gamma-glutamyltransferase E [Varanus komodoensis]|nr:Protein-glutamine gamma-glutamyltransferase E [Varanus komodoensis]